MFQYIYRKLKLEKLIYNKILFLCGAMQLCLGQFSLYHKNENITWRTINRNLNKRNFVFDVMIIEFKNCI